MLVVVLACILVAAAPAIAFPVHGPADTGRRPTVEDRAQFFVDRLAVGLYPEAVEDFGPPLDEQLPADTLARAWRDVEERLGAFRERQALAGRTDDDGRRRVVVRCTMERRTLDVLMTFDADDRIIGLVFAPVDDDERRRPAWRLPPYALPEAVVERPVVVHGDARFPLDGVLTLPRAASSVPAVVLVHPSGAHDGDGSQGAVKPFKDLAWGLATRGMAVLRYDKRTFAHPDGLAAVARSCTVDDEVVIDALAAVDLVRSVPAVDGRRVFLVGHGLGGTLAPRIAARDGRLAGVVLLGAPTGAPADAIVRQCRYLFDLDGTRTDEERRRLSAVEDEAARVRRLQATDADRAECRCFGAWPRYWLSLRDYDGPATAATLDLPILVARGARDFVATEADFAAWQKALAGRTDARFLAYPTCNHLFVEGTGPSSPAEYESPGHVAPQVILGVATWILGCPSAPSTRRFPDER